MIRYTNWKFSPEIDTTSHLTNHFFFQSPDPQSNSTSPCSKSTLSEHAQATHSETLRVCCLAAVCPVCHWSSSPSVLFFRVHSFHPFSFFTSPRSPKFRQSKQTQSSSPSNDASSGFFFFFSFQVSLFLSINPLTDNNLWSLAFSHKNNKRRSGRMLCSKVPFTGPQSYQQGEKKYDKKKTKCPRVSFPTTFFLIFVTTLPTVTFFFFCFSPH